MIKKNIIFFITYYMFLTQFSQAADIEKNTARMQAMDKITGRVSEIDVPVNGAVTFGSFSIIVRSCKTRPVEEAPDNFAFVNITDKTLKGDEVNIFKGWMISSSPATHAVEHPIYDVWLLKCIDTEVDKKQLLSEEQLNQSDNIAMLSYDTTTDDTENDIIEAKQIDSIPEMQAEQLPPENAEAQLLDTEFSYDEDESETSAETIDESAETIDENQTEVPNRETLDNSPINTEEWKKS